MIAGVRAGLITLAVLALMGAGKPDDHGFLLKLTENQLTNADYDESLESAYEASGKGAVIVPVLATLLAREKALMAAHPTSAFPFNAIWALGRVATPEAVRVLEAYQKGPHSHDASLSLKAARLRLSRHDKELGLTIRDEQPLYAANDLKSKVLATFKTGTLVKALAYRVDGPKGALTPRGGPQHFDKVMRMPKGPTGYLARAGDDFATVY